MSKKKDNSEDYSDIDGTAIYKGCSELVVAFAVGLLFCLLISLCSCKSGKVITERVEVPVVVTQEHTVESVKIDHVRDTLIQRDSIYHYVMGDTTIIEKWHYQQGVTNIYKVDTLHVTDSIPYPVTTERVVTQVEQVEKPLRWWQKGLMALGGLLLIGCGLWVAFVIGKKKI